MACYASSCAVPSCASSPFLGLGSPYGWDCGYGLGYSGLGYGGYSYPYAASASSLGIVPGVNPSCVSQLPPSEIVIQPSPSVVTIPGPVLSASCEPVAVGGNTACAAGSYGYDGYRLGRYGYGYGYGLGRYGRGLCGPGYLARRYIPLRRRYCGYVC